MTTVTIPQKLAARGDLVMIPKEEYQAFERWKKTVKVSLAEKWFWASGWQKKEAEADAAIKAGKVHGPFTAHRSLILALKKE